MNSVIEAPIFEPGLLDNPMENPAIKDKKRIHLQMAQGNFVIGDLKNRTLKDVQTSYKPAVIAELRKLENAAQGPRDNKQHLNVSVNFGSHPGQMVSESKDMFEAKTAERGGELKQLIEKNRDPHFKFDDPHKGLGNLMTSVMKANFDFKGNPADHRAFLDPEIKADLRQHHFSYGFHRPDFSTSA